jgi:hypothetical protein
MKYKPWNEAMDCIINKELEAAGYPVPLTDLERNYLRMYALVAGFCNTQEWIDQMRFKHQYFNMTESMHKKLVDSMHKMLRDPLIKEARKAIKSTAAREALINREHEVRVAHNSGYDEGYADGKKDSTATTIEEILTKIIRKVVD